MTPTDKHIVINSWVDNRGIRQFVWYEVTHLNDGALQGRSIELANGRLATCLTVEGDKLIISNGKTHSERELQKSLSFLLELMINPEFVKEVSKMGFEFDISAICKALSSEKGGLYR